MRDGSPDISGRVPPGMISELRQVTRLMVELQAGLIYMKHLHSDQGPRLGDYMEQFNRLDMKAREVYGFQGCVNGDGCPPSSPAPCRFCTGHAR
jgi:hypothetical protein